MSENLNVSGTPSFTPTNGVMGNGGSTENIQNSNNELKSPKGGIKERVTSFLKNRLTAFSSKENFETKLQGKYQKLRDKHGNRVEELIGKNGQEIDGSTFGKRIQAKAAYKSLKKAIEKEIKETNNKAKHSQAGYKENQIDNETKNTPENPDITNDSAPDNLGDDENLLFGLNNGDDDYELVSDDLFVNDHEEGMDGDAQPNTPENPDIPKDSAPVVDMAATEEAANPEGEKALDPESKGVSGDDTSAVDTKENTDEPGAEETTNPDAAKEENPVGDDTNVGGTSGTDAADKIESPDFEESWGESYVDPDDGAEIELKGEEDEGTRPDEGAGGILNKNISNKKETFNLYEENTNNVGDTKPKDGTDFIEKELSGNVEGIEDVFVEMKKGQKQEKFITKALEKFKNENQPELQNKLENKLMRLSKKYSGIALNIRAKTVIGRAYKLAKKFKEIDTLAAKVKSNDDKGNEAFNKKVSSFKEKCAQELLGDIKSGMTHSSKFRAELEKLSQSVGKETEKIETAAYKAIGKVMLKTVINQNFLSKVGFLKGSFVEKMSKEKKTESSKGAGESDVYIGSDEIDGAIKDWNLTSQEIGIADENLKSLLGDRLGYLLQKYGNGDEFTARAQRMIDRARKIESAINGGNSTPTTQDSFAQGAEEKKISDEDKQSFLDLLNVKTGKRFEARFDARLNSLKAKIAREKALQDEIAEKVANENIDNFNFDDSNAIWRYYKDDDKDPIYNETDPNEVIEDPFMKDFEEGL